MTEIRLVSQLEQDALKAIIESKALNVQNGDITLHMLNGIIQSIEIKQFAYKRKT